MKMTTNEVLNTFRVGFEFELFTKMDMKETAKSLQKALGKKIYIPLVVKGFNKKGPAVHTDFVPTDTVYKLEPDYSGGPDMKELVTGPLSYAEARMQHIKICNWIAQNGWTTQKTGIHLNLSFLPMKQKLGSSTILTMDRLKFCLSFDEEAIYKVFPDRRNNTYAKSIKRIIPTHPFIATENIKSVNTGNFKVPSTKYYGVNFLKQPKDYLEFRYLGGADYEKKSQKILDLLDLFCLSIYNTLNNPEYSESDIQQLRKILKNHKKIVDGFFSLEMFSYNFPKIILTVDLQGGSEVLKSFWGTLREALYDLIVNANFKSGHLNYDTEAGKFQIKDSYLKDCNEISNYEIFNSKVSGLISQCDFFDSTIENSHITECKLLKSNLVIMSKVKDCPLQFSNRLEGCYIDNKNALINGNLEDCIIRNGEPSTLAVLKNCLKVKN